MKIKRVLHRVFLFYALILIAAVLAHAQSAPRQMQPRARVQIVAAEKIYGNVLAQLGGDAVEVLSILNRPNQDPHLFEADIGIAQHIARAQLVVYNGAGYDTWMPKLLAASKAPQRIQVEVARLVGKRTGDNPHLWMLPGAMPALAQAAHAALVRIDPSRRRDYDARLTHFLASLKPIAAHIDVLRARVSGLPITATEPIADYLTQALGLHMRNTRFQRAIMNSNEPSVADIAAFEEDLRRRRVKVLIYNAQTAGGSARRMLKIARASGVAVVQFSEVLPENMTYQQWMNAQLDALEHALLSEPVHKQPARP